MYSSDTIAADARSYRRADAFPARFTAALNDYFSLIFFFFFADCCLLIEKENRSRSYSQASEYPYTASRGYERENADRVSTTSIDALLWIDMTPFSCRNLKNWKRDASRFFISKVISRRSQNGESRFPYESRSRSERFCGTVCPVFASIP